MNTFLSSNACRRYVAHSPPISGSHLRRARRATLGGSARACGEPFRGRTHEQITPRLLGVPGGGESHLLEGCEQPWGDLLVSPVSLSAAGRAWGGRPRKGSPDSRADPPKVAHSPPISGSHLRRALPATLG